MAFFNDLVRAVAQAEGMDVMTVTGIGQYARDAGFISKGGRGRSAARMTSRDAANLLIAVNGTPLAKDAGQAVASYRGLKIAPEMFSTIAPDGEGILRRIGAKGIQFGDALELMIEGHIPGDDGARPLDGELSAYLDASGPNATEFWAAKRLKRISIEIGFDRPDLRGFISVAPGGPPNPDPLSRTQIKPIAFAYFWGSSGAAAGERRDRTVIGRRTLNAVGQVLAA